jgi:hypothetical protein
MSFVLSGVLVIGDRSMPGENLDLSSVPNWPNSGVAGGFASPGAPNLPLGKSPFERRFVGIQFACCDVYSRVYINRQGTAYSGHCPKCSRRVELKIAPTGTDARFFTAF